MAQPPTQLMTGLRDIFANDFNTEELTDFAMELGVDYENLAGGTRNAKARELALYLWRHSLIADLATLGPERRPKTDWSLLDPYKPQTASPAPLTLPPTTTTVLEHTDLQQLTTILAANPLFDVPESRKNVLVLSGVSRFINLDLNGPAFNVASSLLVKLNEFGEIAPGDTAIGRVMQYICSDPALPPAHKNIITSILGKYGIQIK